MLPWLCLVHSATEKVSVYILADGREGIISREKFLIDKTYDISPKDHGNYLYLFCIGCCPGSHLSRGVCAGHSWWN